MAKIFSIAKIVIFMKCSINFTINYDLWSPYKWNQLERNVFNYYIAFSVKVVPRSSIKLNTCCVACLHLDNHFLLKHSSCLALMLDPISVLPHNVLSSYAALFKEPIHLLLIKYRFPAVNCSFQPIIFSTLWLKP